VYDLKYVQRTHDLVVATHGRGLFVLDNITALEELTPDVTVKELHVFSTWPAQIRVRPRRLGVAPSRFSAPNPPNGAVIDYYLRQAVDTGAGRQGQRQAPGEPSQGPRRRPGVIITVTTSGGDTVVIDSGGPGKLGVNRYVWNLRYAGPTRINFERPAGEEPEPFFQLAGAGPRVAPGVYSVAVSAAGKTESRTVTVEPDPILGGDPARFRAQLEAGLQLRDERSALNQMLNRLSSLQAQLQSIPQTLRNGGADSASIAPVLQAARGLSRTLKELKDSLYNSELQREAGQDGIHYLSRFQERYQSLGSGGAFAYAQSPGEAVLEEWKELRPRLDAYLARFNAILQTDVAQFNQVAQAHRAPTLVGGEPIQVRTARPR
jgi:hypothetical protein